MIIGNGYCCLGRDFHEMNIERPFIMAKLLTNSKKKCKKVLDNNQSSAVSS